MGAGASRGAGLRDGMAGRAGSGGPPQGRDCGPGYVPRYNSGYKTGYKIGYTARLVTLPLLVPVRGWSASVPAAR
ncbi:hypothetical protein GCM10009799_49290 [Nocardiopsis rhodophaea]|uniref:Uncharacterized protein n=1 Tax=Nocardiopsis rhodophaea TaxID=280238 RepID=A0ABN2TPB9_9ACTN